jgi:integrase
LVRMENRFKYRPWFIQYPHARNPKTGEVQYKTLKASWHKKKAREILLKKQEEFYLSERLGAPPKIEMTFAELIDWGLSQEVMKAKKSANSDHGRAVLLNEHFGNCMALEVTPLMVENFRVRMKKTKSARTGRPFAGSSINKMISLARKIYYLGMDAGIVTSNPFARRGVYKEHPKRQYIVDQDFRKILTHLPEYVKPIALTAYLTGMRRGEILCLTWDRVELETGIIDLSEEQTKTQEPRVLYLNSLPELRKVFVEAALRKSRGHGKVFSRADGKPISKEYMARLFTKACKEAQTSKYRFHDLRHTFNTNMVKAGVQKSVIMRLTGHKTLAMFLRYSHLDRQQSESAMESLGELLYQGKRTVSG